MDQTAAGPLGASRCVLRTGGRVAGLLAVIVLAASVMAGCTAQPTVDKEILAQRPLIWPAPPEPARISFTRSISSPSDIGAKRGFFKRVVEFVLGSETNDIIKPYGIAVDSGGRVIVADTAFKRIHIYDTKAGKYKYIDDAGKQDLISPISVAVDAEDNIFVTDSMARRVFVFNAKGKPVSSFEAGTRPTGLAVDKRAGLVYVVDTGGHRVDVYDLKGRKLRSVGGWGQEAGDFNFPVDIFLSEEGELFVVDTMNYKVQVFDREGNLKGRFGQHGDGTGDFGRPKGIAVDSDGHIYVADALFDTVQIFDREGRYLLSFGTLGSDRGEFWMPGGVFIDGGNNIYVADTFNRRVQVFEYLGDQGTGQ